jgi:hypothetical protein
VTGGTLTRFDNVTFQGFPPLLPYQMRIRHEGTDAALTMRDVQFLVTPEFGGMWIDADDTDATTPVFTLDIVSPQAANGPAYTRQNGAVVSWR